MKAFFATLLLLSILLYSVDANCKDKDGKEVPEKCQRCGPRKLFVFTCKGGKWNPEACGDGESCKQKGDCEAKCE
ncbi:hypothetical protein AAVH_11253 [Aphelenchoides avenae]|nr:hypothetical protein AAVH_40027 [Aphelenchus avenae]KAH7721290.1 hypothetical protein AAVH_11253 [Aphelenchus avenae]